jgi:MazG family protein
MDSFDHASARPVSPPALQEGASLPRLAGLMRRLLSDRGGCAWDRAQTQQSLKKYLQEEASEVLDAIDEADPKHHCEELGDLLFQIVFQTELARMQPEGAFGLDDVIESIVAKLVRRHPHVFGGPAEVDPDQIKRNWETIKAAERCLKPRRILEGVPRNLPALHRAEQLGVRAGKVGFDWPDAASSLTKVEEERAELFEASASGDKDAIEAELGDVLFALVNFARHQGISPEQALHRTSQKFEDRFAHVEDRVRERHNGFEGVSLGTLDAYWNEAKEKTAR